MFKYFKNRRLEREAEIERIRGKHEDKVYDETLKMSSSPCAFIWPEKCFKECVHFRPGLVRFVDYHWSMDDPMFWVEMPKCKLWR